MRNRFLAITLFAAACGGEEVNVKDFEGYGAGHPGAGKVHGGQIFLEHINTPTGAIGILNGLARDFTEEPTVADSLPIPRIPAGTCMDITTAIFPRPPAAGSVFQDLGPEMSVSNGVVTHTAPLKQNFTDNLQYGIPLGCALNPFDATTIQAGATYNVQFNGSENLNPSTMYFAPAYEIFSPPIGKAPVTLTRGQPLEITWDPIGQDTGGTEHTADRTFAFVILLSMPSPVTGQVKWFCPLNDGAGYSSFTVPVEVIDSLPAGGIIVSGQQTHMMAEYNGRRFDLITIACARSPFSFAQ